MGDSDTKCIGLKKEETEFIRTLIRIDLDENPDEFLEGQNLIVTWDEAREIGELTMKHMVKAMSQSHQSGEFGDLDWQHINVQKINQKIIDEFRD